MDAPLQVGAPQSLAPAEHLQADGVFQALGVQPGATVQLGGQQAGFAFGRGGVVVAVGADVLRAQGGVQRFFKPFVRSFGGEFRQVGCLCVMHQQVVARNGLVLAGKRGECGVFAQVEHDAGAVVAHQGCQGLGFRRLQQQVVVCQVNAVGRAVLLRHGAIRISAWYHQHMDVFEQGLEQATWGQFACHHQQGLAGGGGVAMLLAYQQDGGALTGFECGGFGVSSACG